MNIHCLAIYLMMLYCTALTCMSSELISPGIAVNLTGHVIMPHP